MPFSADKDVLVDANIFFAIGRPLNPQYRRFRSAVQNAGVVCKLPRRVIGELGGPETDRVRTALDEGCAEIIDAPSPTDSVESDYKISQSYAPYEWVRTARFTVPNAQSPEEKQTYFVTNCSVDEVTALPIAESYRRRWGIETSYRVIGDFLAKSRSTVYSVRLFYFLFAVLLYSLWVLCNQLLTTVFAWELELPGISAAVLGRLVGQHWRGDLLDPG